MREADCGLICFGLGAVTDGRIAPRSGLAVKNFIDTGAGVIDADYRGQVKVLLFNHSEADFEGTYPSFPPLCTEERRRGEEKQKADKWCLEGSQGRRSGCAASA